MRQRTVILFSVITMLGAGLPLSSAESQPKSLKDQVVGNWTIVSEYQLLRDGTRREVYGAKPLGSLMFGADGRFSYVLFNPDRPKFASGDKSTGTPQDYQAAVQGGQAYFGTYSVDEAKASIIYHIEGALLTGSVQIVSRQILYW